MINKYHVHTSIEDGGWVFRQDGSLEPIFSTQTKEEAVDRAEEYLRVNKGRLYVHKPSAAVEYRIDYE